VGVRTFGKLEAQVMDRLWSFGRPASVREVREQMRGDRQLAYTTVLTVMDKLHKKGWLRRERVGRYHVYEPVASREAYTARLMRNALSTSSNQAVAFVHFLSELTPAEADALRAALRIVPPGDET
jgi:predicted transcriptional regulator